MENNNNKNSTTKTPVKVDPTAPPTKAGATVVLNEVIFNCPLHGEYTTSSVDLGQGPLRTPCPECHKLREKVEAKKELTLKKEQAVLAEGRRQAFRKARVKKRLEHANIALDQADSTLDNWLPCDNEKDWQGTVRNQVETFLNNWTESRGLIFIGNWGTGKTHIATGIVKKFIKDFDRSAHIETCNAIVRRIGQCWSEFKVEPEGNVLKFYAKFDLLVIDECGRFIENRLTKEAITDILDERSRNKKPTILISNSTFDELEQVFLGKTAMERLKVGGAVVVFDGKTSYRDTMTASKIFNKTKKETNK